MIGRFFRFLWALARFFPALGVEGIRIGSFNAIFLSFLFFLFFAIGLVLVLLGIDLGAVDGWLDRQAWWIESAGTVLFKLILAGILLVCALVVVWPVLALFDKPGAAQTGKNDKKIGPAGMGCAALCALAIGYFCFVGIFLQ